MRILDTQNVHLSHNNFDISINDVNLENDVSYIETSMNRYFNVSLKNSLLLQYNKEYFYVASMVLFS